MNSNLAFFLPKFHLSDYINFNSEKLMKMRIFTIKIYLTIRLRARDFYEVIVDEGEARINYHFIEIESE